VVRVENVVDHRHIQYQGDYHGNNLPAFNDLK
jgi:hypothetical protein